MSRIRSTLEECEHQLRPKVQLNDFRRKEVKRQMTRVVFKKNGNHKGLGPHFKVRKPLKKIARSRRTELEHYFALSTEFLLREENRLCIICQVRREHGENIKQNVATETHHHRGRVGRLLCWVPGFRPSCNRCRTWPHDHPREARDWGLLAPPQLWNVFPGNGS